MVRMLTCLLLTALTFAATAQDQPTLRPLDPAVLLIRVTVERLDDEHGPVAVPLDHRFATGDRVRFDVRSSRAGCFSIASVDGRGDLHPLWPRDGGCHPIAAETATRVPAMGGLRFGGRGPTRLALLVSPIATRAASPATPHSTGSRRRWLKQIRLRDVVVDETPVVEEPVTYFQGEIADAETAAVKLVLHHD